ncbi:TetR/AcrR family transcriptional regulator [Jannaschia formosa]|uniref:TetR/AcrR family transcriptional regulator n=1 Tax=Jannaschia formosa TaxID=2259592 RepID=UPI000E1BF573|nr:WHG domain-containing protein [Jannaschia formosa]TFL18946.1 TetR/AcrR family transcriptional regulator [Jannaschia formosa]
MLEKKKKKYHHGDLKPALVQAGLQILEESGLEGLSLRAIAARVGVSHTAPKNHFDGLNGLLAAIAAEGFRLHAAEMRRGVEGMPPGRARLEAAAQGYVRFAQENPALFKLMFSPRFRDSDDADLIASGNESYGVLRSIAEGLDWPAPGPARGPEIEALRTEMMLWSLVHGYVSLHLEGRGPKQPDGSPLLDVLEVMPAFGYRA